MHQRYLQNKRVVKGWLCYIFTSFCETKVNVFVSLQKPFSFSRKSKFRILDIQISWRHQMPKYRKETDFEATFFLNFFDEKFSFVILHELAKFYYQPVFTSQVFSNMCFMFLFSDLMTSWHLNIWKVKIWWF